MAVEFGVLGSLEIRSEGTEIAIGAPKLRALVIALLLDVGRVVAAERLVDDLWGEAATPQAMTSLRSYVSNLRRLLPSVDDTPLIATRGRGYVLDVDPATIDAVRFERLVRAGHELIDDDPAGALGSLDDGLALWRGPALVDVADLDFARASVARLEELRLAAVEDRLDALLRLGRHAEAVAEAEAVVADHPLRERPRRQLMLALYRSGRAPDALAVHRAFRQDLADELGLDPSAELDALADAVLRRDPALDAAPAPRRGGATAPQRPAEAAAPTTAAGETTLVGRTSELAKLSAAVSGLTTGRGGAVLLAGEPGIGKTSLLRRLSSDAEAAGVPVVWGRCHEAQGAPPFWPWVQVLRALAERMDEAALARAVAGTAAAVAHLVPEIAARTGPHEGLDHLDPHAARFALHDAVTTFLGRAAAGSGLVVVVDDLHWGDLASLELAAFLGAQARAAGVLLAGSYRVADADRTPELDATLAALAREETTVTIRLTGLSAEDVGRLAAQVVGAPVEAALVDEMHRRAGGNPFFVRQLAQLRAESDGEVATGSIPVGVRHVLLQRLQLLPEAVRTTLEVASIFGQEFDARPLASCQQASLASVLDHLDIAAEHGLVEDTTGATGWRFVHALIRDTLHDDLRPSRVVRLHAAAADALEQQEPPPVQAIAEHLWHAADLVDHERPIRWLRAAAEDALAVYAPEQGERFLRQALHLLAHRPNAAPAVELDVRVRLVQVLVGLHGWSADGIAEVAARARELAGAAGAAPELTSLWWSRWAFSMTRGDLDEAHDLSQQLLADVTAMGTPAELVAGHVSVAYTGVFRGAPFETVMSHVDQAQQAEARADPATLAMTPERLAVALRVTRSLAHALHGEPALALSVIDDAVVTACRIGLPFSEAYARMFGGIVAALVDDPERARTLTEPGLDRCALMGLEHLANLTVPTHAWASARMGEDPGAQAERMIVAMEGLLAVGHRHAMPLWWALLAEVRLKAGDGAGADQALVASRGLAAELGETVYGAQWARIERAVGTRT